MAEGEALTESAMAVALPPIQDASPKSNGHPPRPGGPEIANAHSGSSPRRVVSDLPPVVVSDIPPRVVSDLQVPSAAAVQTPATSGTVNGINGPSHYVNSNSVNGGHPSHEYPSATAPRRGSKSGTPQPNSRTATPAVEDVKARQPPPPVNIRWREPQTLPPPPPPPASSNNNNSGYTMHNHHPPAPHHSNGVPQSQPITLPPLPPPDSALPVLGSSAMHPPQSQGAPYPPMAQHHPPPPPPPPPPPAASQPPLQPSQGYTFQANSKPIIMDPPSVRNRPGPANGPASGFASPTRDYARESSKFVDDCTRINFAVQQSVPEAVRRIVRDNWEKCLLGSDFHQAFVLNATIHHSSASITRRAVADFGSKMISDCRDEVVRHLSTYDLDAVSDYIVSIASDAFLDKCLEKRLLTIEAKPLINALARAERLGYEQSDVIDLKNQQEQVIPQGRLPAPFPTSSAPSPYHTTPSSYSPNGSIHQPSSQPPALRASPPTGDGKDSKGRELMQCVRCFRTFVYAAAYQHHIEKNVCTRLPPSSCGYKWACEHCGSPFATASGLQYHAANKICLTVQGPPSPSRNPATIPQGPSIPRPGGPGGPGAQAPATPDYRSRPQNIASSAKSTHVAHSTPAPSPIPGDPYAHLTPEAMASMNQELREAEQKFAGRFQEAERITDPDERRVKLDGLKNSFGTKQSMIRKKYGVRLRERRTKAEIAAEKARMGIKQQETTPPKNVTPAAPVSASRSGWTAANVSPANDSLALPENGAKRRRVDESGASVSTARAEATEEEPPRKLVSVAEMGTGGLAGAPATAATQDPTQPSPSQPPQLEQRSATLTDTQPTTNSRPGSSKGSAASSALVTPKKEAGQVIDDDDSDSEMEDIPATLPSHVRQSLMQSASQG